MAGGESRGRRRPVGTGNAKAIRDLLGPDAGTGADDDFGLPPGFESRYAVDKRQRAAERRLSNPQAQARRDAAAAAGTPGARGAAGTRGARGGSSRSSGGSLGIRRAARQASVANPTGGRLPVGLTAGAGAAGLFFGAIAYALLLSVVDYGPSGPLLWFKAKFLNEPASGSPSASGPSSASGGGPTFNAQPPGTPFKAQAGGVSSPAAPAPVRQA